MKTTEEIKSLMLERKCFLEGKLEALEAIGQALEVAGQSSGTLDQALSEEIDEASTELAELTLLIETGKIDWGPEEPTPQGWNKPEKGSIWEGGELYYEVTESKEFGVELMPLNGDGVSCFIKYQEFYESFKSVAWPLPGDTWEHKENSDWLATVTEVSGGSVTYISSNSVWRSRIGIFLDEHRLAT